MLLIEDNPADAYLACEYLKDTGFYVLVAPGATYLVQLSATYSGLSLVDGGFVPSSDCNIEAWEQAIIYVPDC